MDTMLVGTSSHQTRPDAPIPTGWRLTYLWHISVLTRTVYRESHFSEGSGYLVVISNVVPKIWVSVNRGMADDGSIAEVVKSQCGDKLKIWRRRYVKEAEKAGTDKLER